MMVWFAAGMAVLAASGLAGLGLGRWPRLAHALGAGGAISGSLLALYPAVAVLWADSRAGIEIPWQVPYGSLALGLDPLSAFFLIPILGLSALSALYGIQYLSRSAAGLFWGFFNFLIAGMALVVAARNGMLFLMAWELMSLASFFLVTFEHEKPGVQTAGWIYLVAMHLGALCLLVFFILLGQGAGSMDFSAILARGAGAAPAGVLFLLAFLGFGVKAGFMPLHVWLPEAHPAAPSPVSALMSGVMIKTGIYGLVRALSFLGSPETWWGCLLLGAGLLSGVLGVVFALAQHDLKRLLAYHSVENIGIIGLGLGLGVLGLCWHAPMLTVLGFGGGLLHVLNHALFKGLLFLGAGSVLHAAGTAELDRLGGLLKRMPLTGVTFFIGAAAISGLPPLNGFISEFLIYLGAFQGGVSQPPVSAGLLWLTAAGLAMIGALAAACFAKAFGIVFLGEPRTEAAGQARESGWTMTAAMCVLAAACGLIGLAAPLVLQMMHPVIAQVSGLGLDRVQQVVSGPGHLLAVVSGYAAVAILGAAGLLGLRRLLLAARQQGLEPTWDCGFDQPTSRMQYTASSFARPITRWFQFVLQTRRAYQAPKGYFPGHAEFHAQTRDVFRVRGFQPVFSSLAWALSRLRWLQHGRVQFYVLYITLTLLALLVWQLW